MPKFDYELTDHVAVAVMNQGDNRLNYEFLDTFNELLDEIEHRTQATVLVVKSENEKIWSNGIDLEWLLAAMASDPDTAKEFPARLLACFRRLLLYPLTTIAAINGHAFAGGAVLACTFDFRFMRSDRGYFCLPEVDMGLPFWPGMEAVMKKALPGSLALEAQLTGRRYTADELKAAQAVMQACPLDNLMNEIMAFAQTQNKGRGGIKILKEVSFKDILRIMDNDDPPFTETVVRLFNQIAGK
jgi:enoyl-CoA hydratase/carnithine racemase